MGNCDSTPANYTNQCIDDPGDEDGIIQTFQPPNTCVNQSTGIVFRGSSTPSVSEGPPIAELIDYNCTLMGGTSPPGQLYTNGNQIYSDPEWGYNSTGSGCRTNTLEPYYNTTTSSDPFCSSSGNLAVCQKNANYGDPLICSLRDYQCNGSNNPSSKFCFSDDNLNTTCRKDFRAPDTPGSLSNLIQLCLGNYNNGSTGAFDDIDFSNQDYNFLMLWLDNNNPNPDAKSSTWTVSKLPPGSIYQTTNDVQIGAGKCTTKLDGSLSSTCNTHKWDVGQPLAPPTYLPTPEPYKFTDGIPPCQQIFWRVLYGNEPTFTNNYYITKGIDDNTPASEATSIPPQVAACGSIPFGGTPSEAGIINGKIMLKSVVDKYINTYGSLIAPLGRVGQEPFLQWLYSVCSEYPYLCSDAPGLQSSTGFLDNACKNVTSESIKTNPVELQWCGCYMQDNQYDNVYGEGIGDNIISKECTPYCNAADVIPLFDPDTNTIKTCQQSICVIDDVTITLAKSRVNGPITFNNICNSCSPNSDNGTNSNVTTNSNNGNIATNTQSNSSTNVSITCQCITNNINITTIGATINGGINISQACNGNSKCYKTQTIDGKSQTLEIDCHSSSLSANNVAIEEEKRLIKKADDTSNAWIILIIFVVIFIIIALWFVIAPGGVPKEEIEFSKVKYIEPPKQAPLNYQFIYNPPTKSEIKKNKFY